MSSTPLRPRVAAVSYLNTVPLTWGIEHGLQRGTIDLTYRLPSECADDLRAGQADIGLLPVVEMARQNLDYCAETGIACDGSVRSILLISKVPPTEIQTLAADRGSRTSVMLSRIILKKRYGVEPVVTTAEPVLEAMLARNDAALVIGDAALRLEPDSLPWLSLDLGLEWKELTGLPMVFAVWAGKPRFTGPDMSRLFLDSYHYGLSQMDQIVDHEARSRGFAPQVVRQYLTHYIHFELGSRYHDGLRTYLRYAAELEPALLPRTTEVPTAL